MPNAKSHCSRLCKIPTHAQATHPNNLTPAAGPVCLTRRMLRPASMNQTLPTTSQGWAPRLWATRPKKGHPHAAQVRRHLGEACAGAACGKGSPRTNGGEKREEGESESLAQQRGG
jgi:hypothetical protein